VVVTPGRKAVAALSAVLVAVGSAALTLELDLLPLAAALIWIALIPFIRGAASSEIGELRVVGRW
jgi:hypothetical protein